MCKTYFACTTFFVYIGLHKRRPPASGGTPKGANDCTVAHTPKAGRWAARSFKLPGALQPESAESTEPNGYGRVVSWSCYMTSGSYNMIRTAMCTTSCVDGWRTLKMRLSLGASRLAKR